MKTSINETSRKKCLALIHMQKAKANLTDDEYMSFLIGNVGVDSATKIKTQKQFQLVINGLNKILVTKGLKPLGNRFSKDKAFLSAVRARANTILGSSAEKNRKGKDCSPYELRRVMGFLSTVERTEATNLSTYTKRDR